MLLAWPFKFKGATTNTRWTLQSEPQSYNSALWPNTETHNKNHSWGFSTCSIKTLKSHVVPTAFSRLNLSFNPPSAPISLTLLSISFKPTWPVSTGGGSWQTHEAKYAVCLYAGWRVVLHPTLKMSQSASQARQGKARRAKIRHSRCSWTQCSTGLTPSCGHIWLLQ